MDPLRRPRRLFFALWPTDAIRTAMLDLQKTLIPRGKPVPKENFHVTLAFLGPVNAARQACAEAAAARVAALPFDLFLDRLGGFARAGILWSGPTAAPPALLSLVSALRACLKNPRSYCGGPRIAPGCVAKGAKSCHVVHYTPRFRTSRALPEHNRATASLRPGILRHALNRELTACGFEREETPFTPHLTLLRKAEKSMRNLPHRPVEWHVDAFYLVESLTLPQGARYRVLRRWPL